MTTIARYIDDPATIFFWEIDEIVVFALFFGLGMFFDILTIMILVGVAMSLALSKVKSQKAEGFLLHALYWAGVFRLRGCPPSYIREFIE